MVSGHRRQAPDLSMLPEAERPAAARALSKQRRQRRRSRRLEDGR
jgi:hypothetical protein